MHETTVSGTDDIGMVCVKPSVGKYSLPSTSSFVNCLAEFDNEDEAEQFSKDWSESNSKERRRQLIGLHEVKYPDYFRLDGQMLEDYIDYYNDEFANKPKKKMRETGEKIYPNPETPQDLAEEGQFNTPVKEPDPETDQSMIKNPELTVPFYHPET